MPNEEGFERLRVHHWRRAIQKVAQDFAEQYGSVGNMRKVDVQAFLESRQVHYPECRYEEHCKEAP